MTFYYAMLSNLKVRRLLLFDVKYETVIECRMHDDYVSRFYLKKLRNSCKDL